MPWSEKTPMSERRRFIDEFLRMGYPDPAILRLFRDPFYRAPYSIYTAKGEAFVVGMIEGVRSEREASRGTRS